MNVAALRRIAHHLADILTILDDRIARFQIRQRHLVANGDIVPRRQLEIGVVMRHDAQHIRPGRQALHHHNTHIVLGIMHQKLGNSHRPVSLLFATHINSYIRHLTSYRDATGKSMKTQHRPLYAQVRTAITDRIADGVWAGGEALPSEFALAAELDVSQGTVRKALNAMAADNQVERVQGKGTYVPLHTPERALFHFFRFTAPDGAPLRPEPLNQAITRIPVPRQHGDAFPNEPLLWRISRRRGLNGRPALLEEIYISAETFPDIGPEDALPNALYPHYQHLSGRSVSRAEDYLTAEAASEALAEALEIPKGTALLKAERTSYDLRDTVVEKRITRVLTEGAGYRVTLR